jgi:hypothetical protein
VSDPAESPGPSRARRRELIAHEFHTPFWSAGRLLIWSGGSASDVIFTGSDGVMFTPAEP